MESTQFDGFIVRKECEGVFTLHVKAVLATFLCSPFRAKGYSKIAFRTFPSVEAARDWAWSHKWGTGS